MMKAYPAIIHKENGEGYWIEFPDIPGCMTNGKDIEETLTNAQEALGGILAYMMDSDQPLDLPSDISAISVADGFASYVMCDPNKYRKNKAVKKTVSIPLWMEEEAEKRQLSLSATLQKALVTEFER